MLRSICCVAVLCLAGCDAFSRSKPAPMEDGAAPTAVVQAPVARPSEQATPQAQPGSARSEHQGARAGAAAAPEASVLSTPAKGSPERAAILDAIRPWVEAELGQPVIFAVDHLAMKDGYAFLSGRPLQANGERIDYTTTKYRQDLQEGVFDDHLSALVRQSGAGWTLVASSLGATDVPWITWPSDHGAPKEIFPGPIE